MTKLEVVEYHLNKLKYYKQSNKELRSIDNNLKIGDYKRDYDKAVRKYRNKIKLHEGALRVLERMNE